MKEIEISVANFTKAFNKLSEGIDVAKNELDRDGVVSDLSLLLSFYGKQFGLF